MTDTYETPEEIAAKLETVHSYLDSNWIKKAALLIREGEKHRAALRLVQHYFESPLSYSEDEMKFLREAVYTNGESLNGL